MDDALSNSRDATSSDAEVSDHVLALTFLNFSHPSQVKGKKSRKTIRSHVTRLQHEQTRARKFIKVESAAPKSTGVGSQHEIEGEVVPEHVSLAADYPRCTIPTSIPSIEDAAFQAHPPRAEDHDVEHVLRIPQQMAMSRLDPFSAYDYTADWSVDVPSLIDRYLNKARSIMMSQGMFKEAHALHSRLIQPRLYLDGFLFNALITLTTTSVPVLNEQRRPEPIVAWLRSNFLITIRAAVEADRYDQKALAIGIALLVGWEMDVGDPRFCQVHFQALPSIVKSAPDHKPRLADFTYRDQGGEGVFRGGRSIPPGFEFYRSQNLLPPTLMFLVGSLAYWGSQAPGASLWMRELWASIGACAPLKPDVQQNLEQRTIASRVAQLVRQAGIMLGSFMRSSAGERPVAQPLIDGIRALWRSTLSDNWDSMIGTMYDGILLWCLCVFCTTSGYQNEEHLKAIRRLLTQLEIRNLHSLSAFLATFIWPSYMQEPLAVLYSYRSFPPAQKGR